ncbi:MAG: hypothetical protein JWQ62_617, partial [Lacunisphaera sp.]|nr:hypothetical protein [Lacunisphaera sp.]
LSDFARLLRRSPGAVTAMIPSITSAVLLCSAPGFTPSKNTTPINLATLGTMGTLTSTTDLAPGVPVNVQ